jgi:hypothetical protein
MANQEDPKFTEASDALWVQAAIAAAKADDLFAEGHFIWLEYYEAGIKQQQLAMAYLAAGGFHNEDVYAALGLPTNPETPDPLI